MIRKDKIFRWCKNSKIDILILRCINAWLQFHEECEIEKTHKNQLKINNTLYDFHFGMSC